MKLFSLALQAIDKKAFFSGTLDLMDENLQEAIIAYTRS